MTQPFFQKLWKKEEGVSYSTLLRDIDNKKIKQLDLVPARREVRVVYDDGREVSVPIFPNDDRILRAAESFQRHAGCGRHSGKSERSLRVRRRTQLELPVARGRDPIA